jgi:roadblock/LC7 domain-containing protein
MIGLDNLMKRKGVIAAGQFSSDGKVVRAAGDLSTSQMEQVALLCSLQERDADLSGRGMSDATGLNWDGLNGWMVWSGQYALCVSGDTGVIVEASKADFNQLMVDLFGQPAGGMPLM